MINDQLLGAQKLAQKMLREQRRFLEFQETQVLNEFLNAMSFSGSRKSLTDENARRVQAIAKLVDIRAKNQ